MITAEQLLDEMTSSSVAKMSREEEVGIDLARLWIEGQREHVLVQLFLVPLFERVFTVAHLLDNLDDGHRGDFVEALRRLRP